jgi:hypothetical protein
VQSEKCYKKTDINMRTTAVMLIAQYQKKYEGIFTITLLYEIKLIDINYKLNF